MPWQTAQDKVERFVRTGDARRGRGAQERPRRREGQKRYKGRRPLIASWRASCALRAGTVQRNTVTIMPFRETPDPRTTDGSSRLDRLRRGLLHHLRLHTPGAPGLAYPLDPGHLAQDV